MSKLKLKNIKIKSGGKEIVKGVSFEVGKGELVVLMGPNGSGKSTLVNGIMGHPDCEVSSGSFLIDGEDVTGKSTEEKAKKGVFLSLQHIPKIGGMTLATFLHKANLSLGVSDIPILEFYMKLGDLAEEFSIDKKLLDKPLTSELSGGEKKLSEILQLLAIEPKFAILDEIDSGVDVDSLKKVFNVITSLKDKGVGFLLISHNPSLLEYVMPDVVYVINGGKIVSSGNEDLAKEIIKNGFCDVVNCEHLQNCSGKCR
jgi:Fe-S cluster assembly ATP-binding protein